MHEKKSKSISILAENNSKKMNSSAKISENIFFCYVQKDNLDFNAINEIGRLFFCSKFGILEYLFDIKKFQIILILHGKITRKMNFS